MPLLLQAQPRVVPGRAPSQPSSGQRYFRDEAGHRPRRPRGRTNPACRHVGPHGRLSDPRLRPWPAVASPPRPSEESQRLELGGGRKNTQALASRNRKVRTDADDGRHRATRRPRAFSMRDHLTLPRAPNHKIFPLSSRATKRRGKNTIQRLHTSFTQAADALAPEPNER